MHLVLFYTALLKEKLIGLIIMVLNLKKNILHPQVSLIGNGLINAVIKVHIIIWNLLFITGQAWASTLGIKNAKVYRISGFKKVDEYDIIDGQVEKGQVESKTDEIIQDDKYQ